MKSCWKNLWNVTLHCANSRMPDSYFTQSLGKMHIFQTSSCTIRLMRRSHFCLKTSRLLHLDLSASIKCHLKKEGNVHIELKSKILFSNSEKMHIFQTPSCTIQLMQRSNFWLKTSWLLHLNLSALIKCHLKKEGNVHIELKSKISFSNLEKMHIFQASNHTQYSYIISPIQFSLKTSQLLNLDLSA